MQKILYYILYYKRGMNDKIIINNYADVIDIYILFRIKSYLIKTLTN